MLATGNPANFILQACTSTSDTTLTFPRFSFKANIINLVECGADSRSKGSSEGETESQQERERGRGRRGKGGGEETTCVACAPHRDVVHCCSPTY